ncbi:protoporphyrinogen oxidase [Heterostelium album PN500]|uniref:Protoporphyrinogen oxidase n=1 Tax=Heterostelium pallidum (strain ATCC 26659 / Pp 5 / PN500) TaxID=670386 RepID=D3BKE4_HETP5|nr:protoporphyrinogen oxidase [Heterostelium album PN500]EFA78374.1 protoporphyrinogen oxidase [Heterostelium album PN500]|eukprot:XP_020430499.1 protoporphyrinogen oxidase [Heterostelium album PN500]
MSSSILTQGGKRVAVLGGGVSGLTAYHYLTKRVGLAAQLRAKQNEDDMLKIDLFESSPRTGGRIETEVWEKSVIERGPRSIRVAGHGIHTLDLVAELRLENQILFACKKAKTRYMLIDGKVQPLPSSFLNAVRFGFSNGLVYPILSEIFRSRSKEEDESIQSFFSRRLGENAASMFVEPVCLGIHGGDYTRLSIKSCFPSLYELERESGSLILGSLLAKKKQEAESLEKTALSLDHDSVRRVKSMLNKDNDSTRIFSFKDGGLQMLTDKLTKSIPERKLYMNTHIQSIERSDKNGTPVYRLVDSHGNEHEYDTVVSTVPLHQWASKKPLGSFDSELAALCSKMEYSNIAVVNLVYDSTPVRARVSGLGFGYLVASREGLPVLGVAVDSNTFPESAGMGNGGARSIITVMIGGNSGISQRNPQWQDVINMKKSTLIDIAIKHVEQYLGLNEAQTRPIHTAATIYHNAIPHYSVGHQALCKQIEQHLQDKYKGTLQLGGNHMIGVGVNDSIYNSKSIAQKVINRIFNNNNKDNVHYRTDIVK